ncbi:MAG: ABC transporter ATP-binding protein [Anaerolineales bacterium]|jgi:ABC-2 type transport system ATP-binding protein
MSGSPIVETFGLSKAYNGTQALKGLNLTVQPNSIFGFLGPNGAGKTTTMKLLLGLIRPTAGGAKVFGLDIGRDSVEIRSRIGYLPQDPRFYEHMTARETLEYTLRFFFSGPAALLDERIRETLELVGLADKADRPIKGFSGGERQRLGIAQAQINYPDLIILDEPAASLDPLGRHDVLEVMSRLRKHTTIFYSTHILDDVQQISDTVAILNHGELVAHGPIETLLAGSGGVVFSLYLKGDLARAQDRVARQPWVSDIQVTEKAGLTRWLVSVSDEAAAEVELLPAVLQGGEAIVVEYGRKRYELEEVFMNIVEGGSHAGE